MTTTINLRPWREERRKQQTTEFTVLLGVAAALGVLLFFGWKSYMETQVADQRTRNSHIQARIATLDERIKEIDDLRSRRDALVARMDVIQSLQGNRPTIVYVFDQLVRTLPDGVFYSSVQRRGDAYTFEGVAESNNRISRLLRNLDESDWFTSPSLQRVEAVGDGSQANRFTLTVRQSRPGTGEEGEE